MSGRHQRRKASVTPKPSAEMNSGGSLRSRLATASRQVGWCASDRARSDSRFMPTTPPHQPRLAHRGLPTAKAWAVSALEARWQANAAGSRPARSALLGGRGPGGSARPPPRRHHRAARSPSGCDPAHRQDSPVGPAQPLGHDDRAEWPWRATVSRTRSRKRASSKATSGSRIQVRRGVLGVGGGEGRRRRPASRRCAPSPPARRRGCRRWSSRRGPRLRAPRWPGIWPPNHSPGSSCRRCRYHRLPSPRTTVSG